MATKDQSCDICMNLNITTSASVWCPECEEAICEDCESRHRIQKVTKKHKTIPIEDFKELPTAIANIKLECEDHNQKLDFYCSIHNEPCCTLCVSVKHKSCRELKPLPEVVEGVKSSAFVSDFEDRVRDINRVIGELITDKLINKSHLEAQSKTIIAQIERVRKKLNKHLDTIQDDFLNKIATKEEQQRDIIDEMVGKLSKMQNNVEEIVHGLDKTKQHASDFQTFLGVHKWIQEIEVQEREVKSILSDQDMAYVGFQININPLLDRIRKDLSEYGKLEVIFSPSNKLVLRKDKQGQELLIPLPQSISKIKLLKTISFDIPEGESECSITGCDMIEDRQIVFTDSSEVNRRLIVMNTKGSVINEIKLDHKPLDVTIIDSNTVAATLFENKTIAIVDVNTSKILRIIPVNEGCYGICFIDEKLVFCTDGKTIKKIDLMGNVLSTISEIDAATYCSVTKDQIYYAAHSNNVIHCCDINGSAQWKFNCGKSYYPIGIAHDVSGNAFVTCQNANKVIVIDSNGKEFRELLSSDDGLNKPRAIHYNRKHDILVISNYRSGQCFMYKVTH